MSNAPANFVPLRESNAATPIIMGVLNLTADSFSDGGCFLDPRAAIDHADQLIANRADIIDVGAQATNPTAQDVEPAEEVSRLTPVVRHIRSRGVAVSVDTFRPLVMRAMLALGVDYINDISGFVSAESLDAVRHGPARLIAMHQTHSMHEFFATPAPTARAAGDDITPAQLIQRIDNWFTERLSALAAADIARERIVLDPGMGLFLGRDPQLSVAVLRELPRWGTLGVPLLVGISRKSFLATLIADPADSTPRPPTDRAAATLAAELFAATQGAKILRTHSPRALRDALATWSGLQG